MRKLFLIMSLISFIGIIVFFGYLKLDKLSGTSCGCSNVISQNSFLIFFVLIIIFSINIFYYFYSLSISKKEKIILSNQNTIYSILNDDEKKLINLILKNKGVIEQKFISKKYGKIKAHRLIQKLKDKNIVFIKKINNKNIINLNKDLELIL
jgi:uncharacterized membrane protein